MDLLELVKKLLKNKMASELRLKKLRSAMKGDSSTRKCLLTIFHDVTDVTVRSKNEKLQFLIKLFDGTDEELWLETALPDSLIEFTCRWARKIVIESNVKNTRFLKFIIMNPHLNRIEICSEDLMSAWLKLIKRNRNAPQFTTSLEIVRVCRCSGSTNLELTVPSIASRLEAGETVFLTQQLLRVLPSTKQCMLEKLNINFSAGASFAELEECDFFQKEFERLQPCFPYLDAIALTNVKELISSDDPHTIKTTMTGSISLMDAFTQSFINQFNIDLFCRFIVYKNAETSELFKVWGEELCKELSDYAVEDGLEDDDEDCLHLTKTLERENGVQVNVELIAYKS